MKYGFVYVWRDKKRNMFYVGCHWGSESDKYVCSSTRMRNAYNRRKEDFKRRIVSRVYTTRLDLLVEEHKWLSQIKDEELGKKFYNMSKRHFGHWSSTDRASEVAQRVANAQRGKKRGPYSEEHKLAISIAKKGKFTEAMRDQLNRLAEKKRGTVSPLRGVPLSIETKRKISAAKTGVKRAPFSEETRQKMRESWVTRKTRNHTNGK